MTWKRWVEDGGLGQQLELSKREPFRKCGPKMDQKMDQKMAETGPKCERRSTQWRRLLEQKARRGRMDEIESRGDERRAEDDCLSLWRTSIWRPTSSNIDLSAPSLCQRGSTRVLLVNRLNQLAVTCNPPRCLHRRCSRRRPLKRHRHLKLDGDICIVCQSFAKPPLTIEHPLVTAVMLLLQ